MKAERKSEIFSKQNIRVEAFRDNAVNYPAVDTCENR